MCLKWILFKNINIKILLIIKSRKEQGDQLKFVTNSDEIRKKNEISVQEYLTVIEPLKFWIRIVKNDFNIIIRN